MRTVSLAPLSGNASTDQKLDWCIRAIQELARATNEDAISVFDSYATDTMAAVTRTLNVTSPSPSNIAAVIATLIADLKRRGVKRSG